MSVTAIGVGLAAFACIGAGLSIGIATGKAAEAIARQPEADGKIMRILLLRSNDPARDDVREGTDETALSEGGAAKRQ